MVFKSAIKCVILNTDMLQVAVCRFVQNGLAVVGGVNVNASLAENL